MPNPKIYLNPVPQPLKERLIADAEAQGTNMNDVAVRILADRYGVKIDAPPSRKASADPDRLFLMLRPPPELRRAIHIAAASRDRSRAQEALAALLEHYGLEGVAQPSSAAAA